jgi:phytoene dehydrogenase-like protein
MAAHGMLPLERSPSAAFGLMLMLLGSGSGWPIARGGSQSITQALARLLLQAGGRIETGVEVRSSRQLAGARLVLFDTTPNQMVRIIGDRLSTVYRNAVARFRHNPGVFKIDWALREPIPWSNPLCRETATVHIGGTLEEVAAAERDVWAGRHPRRPFVLLAQASLFDSSRAPAGKHTGWGYCHVPGGSVADMTDAIEAQVERFAPGFREIVLARHTFNTVEMEAYNPNYVGGDINGGVQDMWQHFTRPIRSALPYRTSTPGIYLCSASTPPGGGVHGMCGYHAAQAALEDLAHGRA